MEADIYKVQKMFSSQKSCKLSTVLAAALIDHAFVCGILLEADGASINTEVFSTSMNVADETSNREGGGNSGDTSGAQEVDTDSGVEENKIQMVMASTECSRDEAINALLSHENDVARAVQFRQSSFGVFYKSSNY